MAKMLEIQSVVMNPTSTTTGSKVTFKVGIIEVDAPAYVADDYRATSNNYELFTGDGLM